MSGFPEIAAAVIFWLLAVAALLLTLVGVPKLLVEYCWTVKTFVFIFTEKIWANVQILSLLQFFWASFFRFFYLYIIIFLLFLSHFQKDVIIFLSIFFFLLLQLHFSFTRCFSLSHTRKFFPLHTQKKVNLTTTNLKSQRTTFKIQNKTIRFKDFCLKTFRFQNLQIFFTEK